MKNKPKNIVTISIIILLIIGVIGIITVKISKANKENWITDNEQLYLKATEYIEREKRKNGYDNIKQDYQVFTDYQGFGIEEKNNKKYAYMWILEETYYVEDEQIKSSEGSSMAYKFTFENNEVIDYETPKDGDLYSSSIKEMFPDSIEDKILNYHMDNSKLKEKVKEYYSYLKDNVKKDTKNYNNNLKIAYTNEKDKENSEFIYSEDTEKNDYNWNEYIVENRTILKDMPEIDFRKFKELGNDFYCLKITDYETYNEYSENYNFKKLDEKDFNNIFAEIIIRKSSDNTIKCKDIIKGYEYIENEENYTLPITIGGWLDVSENFKYPCMVIYLPNYMNKHYDDFYFKVMAQDETIKINKEVALEKAKTYLSNLNYKGCYNFTGMDYIRISKEHRNDFLTTENKEEPIKDINKEYTVWSIHAYSENDPCTSAKICIDVVTGEIIGGILYFATD